MGIKIVVSGGGYSVTFARSNDDELIAKAEVLDAVEKWAKGEKDKTLGEIAAKLPKDRPNEP